MKPLQKYLKEHNLNQTQFAEMIGANQGQVSMWLSKKIRMTPDWVLKVERVTGGELSRYELRPDVYPRDNAA